ncbi:MAG: DoxX family protein [Bryobacterales bacterium]|nr:DoxX family protein [Bryobacterales bacterium]MDE0628580.1 DoxX family protein [Bryobacterales bacterium]
MICDCPKATHALLRIVTAFLFIPHGYQKLFGLGGVGPRDGVLPMIAGSIELVGGILILIGFKTRWVAFLCSGLMAAAYFMAHAKDGFLPLLNRGELAVLYCFVFLFLWANGSGPWSVDDLLAKRKDS